MSKGSYSAEFKAEAVKQIIDRKYSVSEVSKRLGVSAHSLYQWVRQAKPLPENGPEQELLEARREVLKLKAELRRAEEERDILKKAAAYFARGHE
jgi:transposase